MVCGSKWKSCDCPFFNESISSAPADYMEVAMDPTPNPFAGNRFDGPSAIAAFALSKIAARLATSRQFGGSQLRSGG